MHRRLAVKGQVQGAGFRPWVWQQASALGLIGWVRNTGFGVEIDLHGDASLLDTFQARLWQVPSPARVEQVDVVALKVGEEPGGAASQAQFLETPAGITGTHARSTAIGADLGVCPRCLNELFDEGHRRWRHPFIDCPQCGPRYTITRSLPFERGHTSMARFVACAACEAEYGNSHDRRFRHQSLACSQCGPRLSLRQGDGSVDTENPIAATFKLLSEGGIVAIKGLGGFHLCCDARQAAAVNRLRQRKRRDSQPMAVMVANAASVKPWARLHAHEQRWLQSPERPIVLLEQTERARRELSDVAPGLAWMGVMLPYTPIHYLLFHEACGRPLDINWLKQAQDLTLAVTSGNAAGSPLVTDNETALLELAELADAWLMHDREILARNDDSVLRVRPDGSACFVRRARGYAPTPVALPARDHQPDDHSLPPAVLALGALLKTTLCITQGDRALVSPHVGDLDSVDTRVVFTRMADLWPGWLNTQPDALACDLHPDFFSTILAAHLTHTRASTASGIGPLPLIQVQHHHAHIAAVLAEHSDQKEALQPVVGLALDGHGLGSNGQAWGGELLRVHGDQAQRLGHLRPIAMAGGEAAMREPWRMAAAVLHDLGLGHELSARFGHHAALPMVQRWLQQPTSQQAHTTSLGRLFDAAAGLLGVLDAPASRYEAEAAMRLESLAMLAWPAQPLAEGWVVHESMELDWRPLMTWLARHTMPSPRDETPLSMAHMAAVFHATVSAALADWAKQACAKHGMRTVVLGGGCLVNRLLDDSLHDHLTATGLQVWRATQYPCGDGGLSLGQAWVARQRLIRRADTLASPRS